jgi:glutamate-1-semialdehyde 2,1-aminomutase
VTTQRAGALPHYTFDETRRRMAEGSQWLPGGASSDYRMGDTALVIDRAEGALLHDVDGNRLIDYYLGAGPIILGHTPAPVVEAVTRQITRGVQLGGETAEEYEAARLVTEIVPSAEMVRFANTGGEAVQLALRIARGATGRDVIVKFEGHYHGWIDSVFVGLPNRSGVAPSAASGRERLSTAGQDPLAIENTVVLPWNDLDAVEARLARGDVAAVLTEPLWRGYITARPGYLEGLREITRRHDVVLIFDEIVSGFRVAPGGAQSVFGVLPDLTTFAKAMANGFVISAVSGRRDLMSLIGGGPVVHPGTYNGNALSMAAAVATLTMLAEGTPHENIERAGGRLMSGFSSVLASRGVKGIVQGVPGSFNVHLGLDRPVETFADTTAGDAAKGNALVLALLERGVRAIPGGHWYVSAAHTDELVDETLAIFEDAVAAIA